MRKRHVFISVVALSALQAGCGSGVTRDEGATLSESKIAASIQADGLTCSTQQAISALDEGENARLGVLIQETLTQEQFAQIVEDRELGCENGDAQAGGNSDVGVASQAITGTYVVERIEEDYDYQGSWGGSTVYRDGAAYGHMCGSDSDYIVEFDSIYGAYTYHSNLEMVGLSSRGRCLLGFLGRHYTDARVYSDNDIRACIGYWGAVWCGAPRSGDLWPHS
jgi:hypothetical protein